MVSFVTLRAFEMALAVSRTRLISKRMSKDSLVVSLTIDCYTLLLYSNSRRWIEMEPDAPGVRIRKRVGHSPVTENALCF